MTEGAEGIWTDRAFLRQVQYRTDVNLAARQSIYAYQQPPIHLPGRVLDLAALTGRETIADVGCGNGAYLAELARRGHAGRVVGADMSPGMLDAARRRAHDAALLTADATALPLRDAVADLTVAMHMLYHVPDPDLAVRELRRVTRRGGRVIVGLNGDDHLRELRVIIVEALRDTGHDTPSVVHERLSLSRGESLLRRTFNSVTRHDFTSALLLPGPEPVVGYVRSMSVASDLAGPGPLVSAVTRRLPNGSGVTFRVTTHSGCLVCA